MTPKLKQKKHDTPKKTEIVLQRLPIKKLVPNAFNPNRMTAEEFQGYVAEVKRLGHPPKPIVVRPKGDHYEILDGEHAWKAADDAGFEEVLCDVIPADDFEARLQCFLRNQHGTHNPVLEARLFADLKRIGE